MAKQQQSSKVRKQSKTAMKSSKASTVSHKTKITSKPKKTVFEDQDIEEHVEKLDNIDADDDIEMHHADKCDRIEGDNGENGQHSVIHPEGDDAETPKAKKAKVHSGSNDSHAQNGDGTKKPSRDEQKRLLKERKAQKPHANIIFTAKKLWEQLRRKDIKPDKRAPVMQELMNAVTGHIQELIFKHDSSRVVQSMLKYGSSPQRDAIATELKGTFVELSKNQYSRFLISKILNYCPKHRDAVMKEFHGKVRKLIRQKSASLVIEEVFAQYANSTQRSQLVEEFYGPQYALFKGTGGSSLADLLKESPAKKPYVMKHLREAIDSIIDKGQADIGPHSIVHKIILEYLNHADASDIVTLIEPLKDQIIRILHTREGSRLSQIVFAHATAKDRKHIIKTFKSYLAKITKEQYGYGVLLSVLESTDDTVLSGKACIGEIVSDNNQLKECCMDQHASKVILHALVGRNKKYLNPSLVSQLESLDAIKSSKKDDALKHIELLAVWKQPLKDVVMKNFEELVKDRYGSHVVAEVLRVLGDDELFSKLTEALSKPTGSHNSSAGAVKNEDVEISTEGEDGSQKDGDGSESDEAYQTAPESTPQRKPFHPIKALSAELNKALTPTNTEHILINRTSNSIIKELITSGRRVAISETPPLAPDTEIAGKLSDIVALAIQPSIALLLEYCSEDVKRSSGIAFLLVGLVERGTEEARKVVLDGISSFGVEKLRGEVERQKSGMEEKKTESDVNKKREKRKRDDEGTETKSSMSGLEVLLHRCTQIVA